MLTKKAKDEEKIFGAIGAVWGAGIIINWLLSNQSGGSGAYQAGQIGAVIIGTILFIVSVYAFLKNQKIHPNTNLRHIVSNRGMVGFAMLLLFEFIRRWQRFKSACISRRVCRFSEGKLRELHEYMDMELVTKTFGTDDES